MSSTRRFDNVTVWFVIAALGLSGSGWCELQGQRIWTPQFEPKHGTVRGMAPVNDGLLLFATTYDGGQVWFSDLTPEGTTLLGEIPSVGAWFTEAPLTMTVDGTVYFTVSDLSGNKKLGGSDGTVGGTVEIASSGFFLGESHGT